MTNSRAKGARGEREFARLLQDHGLMARRGQQFRGGPDSPDVICESWPWSHWEVKWRQQHNFWDWMTQAAEEMAPGRVPLVAAKKNGKPWLVAMRAEDFIEMAKAYAEMRETGRVPGVPNVQVQEHTEDEGAGDHGHTEERGGV